MIVKYPPALATLPILLLLSSMGCTSIDSTMLTRDNFNSHWERHRHLHGIPITLKVPTHVKLHVFDKHYLEIVTTGGINEVVPVELDVPVRDFAHELMYTEKIFTVDFKRPAAGLSNLRLDMSQDQYFAKIQHDVTDETIAQVTALLGQIMPRGALFGQQVMDETVQGKPVFKELRSVVAVGVFEIDSPDFEHQVMAFLDCHINKAHDAWVVPPGVEYIKRVGVTGPNLMVPYPPQPFCPPGGECWVD